MVAEKLFSFIDKVLRLIRNPSLPFGGLHIITICQLLPVMKPALYADVTATDLWHSFNHIVILKQQGRAASDPAFRQILTRCREHRNTAADFDLLKSRIIGFSPLLHTNLQDPEWLHAVTRNKAARALNLMRLRSYCAITRTSEIIFPSEDFIQGFAMTSTHVRLRLVQLEDSHEKTPKLSRTLHLAIGAKFSLTSNIKTELGLVNGAQGTVAQVLLVRTHTSSAAPNSLFLDRPPIVLFRPDEPHPLLYKFTFPSLES
jgi:hypothetical protein